MNPITTPETNHTYKLSGGTSENDLPCFLTEDRKVISTWELDDDERKRLVADRVLQLWIWWANEIGCSVTIAGVEYNGDTLRSSKFGDEQILKELVLDDSTCAVIEDGATVTVMIDMAPPPPIALVVP